MYFTRKGTWLLFGISFACSTLAYLVAATATGSIWASWMIAAAVGLAVLVGIIVGLKIIYIRIGMDSGSVDWDDPDLVSRRTRDGSGLTRRECCNCAVILWEGVPSAGPDVAAIQTFTGFSGFSHASVDCCLYDQNGDHWMIESTVKDIRSPAEIKARRDEKILDGPQFSLINSYRDRRFRRIPIGNLINCNKLCECLRGQVEDKIQPRPPASDDPTAPYRVRHKTASHPFSLLFGLDDDDLVTCSGLIARCIEKQKKSTLDRKLQGALDARLVGGEVSPSDLARAFGIDEANLRLTKGPPS
jgi:hypothetical protein